MFLKARSPGTLRNITWWAKMDSNHRPHDYQSCALASWAIGPYSLGSLLLRYLVEISGIEPLTSCLQGRRSPSWAKPPYRRSKLRSFRFRLQPSASGENFMSLRYSSSPNETRFAGLFVGRGRELRSLRDVSEKLVLLRIMQASQRLKL